MTNNEAIQELNECYLIQSDEEGRRRNEAVTMAIEALEMRAAEEPTNIEKNFGMYFGLCPDCRCNVSSADSYCSICGQALRWKK